MMKMMKRSFLLMITMVILFANISSAATGAAGIYYQTNYGHGHMSRVATLIREMGYSTISIADSGESTLVDALKTKKIIVSACHGTTDGALSLIDGTLTPSEISNQCSSLSNLKFALLEGCYTDAPATVIYNKGASCTIGFSSTVSASSQTNGIHLYVSYLVGYAKTNNITNSHAYALSTTYSTYGSYAGAEYADIKGGNTTIY